jgi:hypothetical protein
MLFNMKQLLEFAKQTMERYPAIKSNIEELIELCVMEIEDGGSRRHEIELCKTSIQDLILEYNEN